MLLSVLLLLLLRSCQQPVEVLHQGDVAFVPMETERLSDLNEPRSGHALVLTGDQILVVGGHTTGFVASSTAEYYSGKRWHTIPTIYSHDTPFALVLKDGDVLIGGGYEKDFGVGQTWGVECYHPTTHSFSPSSIMDQKRAHASALEMEDGSIVISGNWYATDFTEIYNGDVLWTDTASDNRSYPFILPVGEGNAWIIGATYESYGGATKNIVDQIKGEPFNVALLDEWHPKSPLDRNVQADAYRVAEHAFLIPAVNSEGQCAPMLVDSTGFSLLHIKQPLPMEGPWGAIRYFGSFWTVPETETAWMMGLDEQNHVFLAEIGYQQALQGGKASLTMYYTQPLEALPTDPYEMLLPDGSFVMVGGLNHTNYDSSATVYTFYPNAAPKRFSAVFFIGIGLVLVIGLWLVLIVRKRKRRQEKTIGITEQEPSQEKTEWGDKLKMLMEEKQLFRNKDLRIADVAAALGTNTTYLSACLNGELNTTFPAFVTSYRIRYAQDMMRQNPTMRLSQVAEESGFTNEKTFLRTFKSFCGLTPSEWKIKKR